MAVLDSLNVTKWRKEKRWQTGARDSISQGSLLTRTRTSLRALIMAAQVRVPDAREAKQPEMSEFGAEKGLL